MTEIVRAAGAAQFLSFVPRLAGITPARSVVAVPFTGRRTMGLMRLDLPGAGRAGERAFAATLVGLLCRIEGATAAAIVIYADEATRDAPRRPLVRAIEQRMDAAGLPVHDALWVGARRWGRYGDPSVGGARAEVMTGAYEGGLADDAVPPDLERPFVDAVRHELGRPMAVPAALRDDLPAFFERMLADDDDDQDAAAIAALVWALDRPALRDVGLLTWCDGVDRGDQAVRAQLDWEADVAYPMSLARRMWGEGPRPDPPRLLRALAVARRAAAAAPPTHRAGALATCAWLSWALGRSSHADGYVRAAREHEASHGLADIVGRFVAAGHLPDWAFRGRAERALAAQEPVT